MGVKLEFVNPEYSEIYVGDLVVDRARENTVGQVTDMPGIGTASVYWFNLGFIDQVKLANLIRFRRHQALHLVQE